jgi:hypothetical protein
VGNVLNFAGRPEEALERMEQVSCSTAFVTGPDFCFGVLGDAYYLTRRYEEAIAAYKQVLSHKPSVVFRLLIGLYMVIKILLCKSNKQFCNKRFNVNYKLVI